MWTAAVATGDQVSRQAFEHQERWRIVSLVELYLITIIEA